MHWQDAHVAWVRWVREGWSVGGCNWVVGGVGCGKEGRFGAKPTSFSEDAVYHSPVITAQKINSVTNVMTKWATPPESRQTCGLHVLTEVWGLLEGSITFNEAIFQEHAAPKGALTDWGRQEGLANAEPRIFLSRFFISDTTMPQFDKMLLQVFSCNYFSLICGSDLQGTWLKMELGL